MRLIGLRFARLVVLRVEYRATTHATRVRTRHICVCQCDCGNETRVDHYNLKAGHTQSCGCLNTETRTKRLTKHSGYGTPTYKSWANMKERCLTPTHHAYPEYGGRGIAVHQPWAVSFEAFRADVGERPGRAYSIDRIDNNGNYEPGNVRWATKMTQANNQRSNRRLALDGVTKTIAEWSRATGISKGTISSRLRAGWRTKDALLRPVDHSKRNRQARLLVEGAAGEFR